MSVKFLALCSEVWRGVDALWSPSKISIIRSRRTFLFTLLCTGNQNKTQVTKCYTSIERTFERTDCTTLTACTIDIHIHPKDTQSPWAITIRCILPFDSTFFTFFHFVLPFLFSHHNSFKIQSIRTPVHAGSSISITKNHFWGLLFQRGK